MQRGRGDDLEVAEECVGGRVAAGEEDAEPAEHRAEKRKRRTGGRQREPQRRRHAGIVHHVRQRKHQAIVTNGSASCLKVPR